MVKVSVVMGVYNNQDTVEEAIESILHQTYNNWEFIICDDCSNDNTWSLLNEIARRDSRIILLRNRHNLGLAATLNRCISVSSGEYIARQDGDDVSLDNRLEVQVNFLDKNEDISVVGSYVYLMDQEGRKWGTIRPPEVPQKKDWAKSATIIHASTLMRKSDILSVGMYNERALRVEDYDLWMKLVSSGFNIRTIPLFLYSVRWSLGDYSRRRFKYRLNEMKVRFDGYRKLRLPLRYYFYVFKPLVVGVLPSQLIYLYHRKKFKDESCL